MENKTSTTPETANSIKPDVSGSLRIAVASIRANYELWKKSEIKDGAFSWHLHNNLARIEKELDSNDR